jgi:thiosulfate/3-mercaptopyruvate sulfurtransferase
MFWWQAEEEVLHHESGILPIPTGSPGDFMRHSSHSRVVVAVLAIAGFLTPAVTSAQQPSTNDMLMTTTWLSEHLRDPKLVLIWTGGTAPAQLIPGSRVVPHERVMTMSGGHDLSPADDLVATMRHTGISNDSHVVIYGEPMAAGWLFFALDYLGHEHVSLLDGGLEKWTAEKRPVAPAVASSVVGGLTARVRAARKSSATDVQKRSTGGRAIVLDARTSEEYARGHIPGARWLEWTNVFAEPNTMVFKKPDELRALFARAGVTPEKAAITYCAVGLRASVLFFAAKYAGIDASNYVGSWRDWQEKQLPTEK